MPELEENIPEANVSPRVSRSRAKWVALVSLLILALAGGWFWLSHNGGTPAAAGEEPRVQSTLHLDSFVLNLADSDTRSYLRLGIDLGLRQELKRDEPAPVAQVRDTILGVLADSKADELMTSGGKARLKEKLLHALQDRVPELGVEEVYFTEFLIQR